MRKVTVTGMKHNDVEYQVEADFPLILLDEGEVAVNIKNLQDLMENCAYTNNGKCYYYDIVGLCSIERCPILSIEGDK